MTNRIKKINLECADIFAPNYDREVLANGWCAPEIIFDLMSEFVLLLFRKMEIVGYNQIT
jgi:hypothetical protein